MTHSQRRFFTQHIVAMLEQCCKHLKQCRNNVATLCYAKNRRCESSRVKSPLWRTWTYYDEFPFIFLSLNKILKNSTPGKVESLKECKFIFLPSFSLPPSSSLLKVPNDHACGWRPGRREAGDVGARALVLRIFSGQRARVRSPHYIWRKGETPGSLGKHGGKKIWVWTW